MLARRFWIACGLSVALHLLVMQVPLRHAAPGRGPLPGARPLAAELRLVARAATEPAAAVPPEVPQSAAENAAASLPSSDPPPSSNPPQSSATGDRGESAARYFKSSEVDRRAEPIAMPALLYPDAAFRQGIAGRVVLRVYVNETGGIDAIDVVESEPAGVFEQAAVDAVLDTRFTPAELFGRPVKNVKTIEIRLDPGADLPPAAPPSPARPPAPAAAGN